MIEFIENTHTYIVDGIIVPSVTQILGLRFGDKYKFVDSETLKRASDYGTEVHKAIEDYCLKGTESEHKELRNFKFLQKAYGFKVLENEVSVALYEDGFPIFAGRLDLVLEINGKIGGADIKTTSVLDKEYLGYQLNLYRLAYKQTYGKEWEFLKGVHLKGDKRKLVDIPINEKLAWDLVEDWRKYESSNT